MDAQGNSPIGLAMVAPTTPRPLLAKESSNNHITTSSSSSNRYRNDPYRAAVLPQLLPQPPTHMNTNPSHSHHVNSFAPSLPSSTTTQQTRVPLPPVHIHHLHTTVKTTATPTSALPPQNMAATAPRGFASRVKSDVARASAAAFVTDEVVSSNGSTQHSSNFTTASSFAYIRFKHDSACYKLPFPVRSGDYVVVEADRGTNAGMVERVTADAPSYPVHSQVVRFASHEEVMTLTCLRLEERDVLDYVQETVSAFGLEMNVVDVEFQFDRRKLTIFFEATATVDFRRLQRALFKQYGCRIWLVLWRDSHHQQRGASGSQSRRLPVPPSSI